MLAVTLVMYGLSTWEWAVDVYLLRDELKVLLPADLTQPPPDHARRIKVNTALHVAQGFTNNICVCYIHAVVASRHGFESFADQSSPGRAERHGSMLAGLCRLLQKQTCSSHGTFTPPCPGSYVSHSPLTYFRRS